MLERSLGVLGVVAGACGLARLGDPLPVARETPRGHVVVAIPAHNEARHIDVVLASIRRQRCEHLDVRLVVVDDASDDETAERARRAGAHVISAGPVADGVNPKAAALAHVDLGDADWVLFVDADVEFVADDGLARLIAMVETNDGGSCRSSRAHASTAGGHH